MFVLTFRFCQILIFIVISINARNKISEEVYILSNKYIGRIELNLIL